MHEDDTRGESAHLRVGMRLDRYELVASLAAGGMGAVWLARLQGVRGFEKLVAIKTIRPQYSSSGRFERMFLDEARISSRLQHPNIAPILELGEQDEVLYLVMEYVEGETLSHLRRAAQSLAERVPLAITLRVLADACAGLHAAHELQDEQGRPLCVVHRDASPHNILVATNGTVKVIDFGVAKARDRCAEETTMGELKGKLQYMPREQAMSAEIDRRADIWSIGACLYELVAGHAPWEAASVTTTVRRLMDQEPPRALPADVPAAVREIIARSLVHDRDARYPSALAMRRALEDAIVLLGLRATSEDVGVYVRRVCANSIDERRRVIAEAMETASSRHRAAPPSLAAVSIAAEYAEETCATRASPSSPTRVARPRLLRVDTGPRVDPANLRTPTPTSTSSPPRYGNPPRRPGLAFVSLFVAALAFFFARSPASPLPEPVDVRPSAALSPLSEPAAPVVDHIASPTCPAEMVAVAEPLTWTPYCIDKSAVALEGGRPCRKSGACAARDVATRYCIAQGKRLATDEELALAGSNELVTIDKPAKVTKLSPVTSFRCARSL